MDFLTEYIDDAVIVLDPTLKTELINAVDPFLDYLIGDISQISIEISMAEVAENIENDLRNEFHSSPPSEYSELSPSELDEIFDTYIAGRLSEMLPETFEIDESIIGPDIPSHFSDAIIDVEQNLTDVRNELDNLVIETQEPLKISKQYVSYFQLAYALLIVFIVLMVLCIVLLLRDVRVICRRIGIPLFIYGLLEYAAIWVGRYFFEGKISYPNDFPYTAKKMITDITHSAMHPLEIYSLIMMIVGVILIVISLMYKRGQQEPEMEVDVNE
jgi:uncharacterized protein YjeT (DUF2065 family)